MDRLQIEQKLIPRLKILGIILLVFSVIALAYSFVPNDPVEEVAADEELLTAFGQPPPMNMYLVAAVLGSVGATCITIAWRKKNGFKTPDSDR